MKTLLETLSRRRTTGKKGIGEEELTI